MARVTGLRKSDQTVVAAAAMIGLVMMAAWWICGGGARGRLVDIDRAPPRSFPFQVDLNSAGWTELALLPGIGERLARRVVESRREVGPFRDHDDLLRVKGIGPKTLAAIRPYLRPLDHGQ